MPMFRLLLTCLLCLTVSAAVTPSAHAGKKDKNKNKQAIKSYEKKIKELEKANKRDQKTLGELVEKGKAAKSAMQRSGEQLKRARRSMNEAETELHRGQRDLAQLRKELELAYESSGPMAEALAALEAARTERGAAREAAIAPLQDDPKYIVLNRSIERLEEQTSRLRGSGESPRLLQSRAELLLKQKAERTAMENAALEDDEAYQKADRALREAARRVNALRAQFEQELAADTGYTAMQQRVRTLSERRRMLTDAYGEARREHDRDSRTFDAVADRARRLQGLIARRKDAIGDYKRRIKALK